VYQVIQENLIEFLLQSSLSYIFKPWSVYIYLTYPKGYVVYIRPAHYSYVVIMSFSLCFVIDVTVICNIILPLLLSSNKKNRNTKKEKIKRIK